MAFQSALQWPKQPQSTDCGNCTYCVTKRKIIACSLLFRPHPPPIGHLRTELSCRFSWQASTCTFWNFSSQPFRQVRTALSVHPEGKFKKMSLLDPFWEKAKLHNSFRKECPRELLFLGVYSDCTRE